MLHYVGGDCARFHPLVEIMVAHITLACSGEIVLKAPEDTSVPRRYG